MRFLNSWVKALIAICGVYCMTQGVALAAGQEPVRNVVLVHGAWADAAVGQRSSPCSRNGGCMSWPFKTRSAAWRTTSPPPSV